MQKAEETHQFNTLTLKHRHFIFSVSVTTRVQAARRQVQGPWSSGLLGLSGVWGAKSVRSLLVPVCEPCSSLPTAFCNVSLSPQTGVLCQNYINSAWLLVRSQPTESLTCSLLFLITPNIMSLSNRWSLVGDTFQDWGFWGTGRAFRSRQNTEQVLQEWHVWEGLVRRREHGQWQEAICHPDSVWPPWTCFLSYEMKEAVALGSVQGLRVTPSRDWSVPKTAPSYWKRATLSWLSISFSSKHFISIRHQGWLEEICMNCRIKLYDYYVMW